MRTKVPVLLIAPIFVLLLPVARALGQQGIPLEPSTRARSCPKIRNSPPSARETNNPPTQAMVALLLIMAAVMTGEPPTPSGRPSSRAGEPPTRQGEDFHAERRSLLREIDHLRRNRRELLEERTAFRERIGALSRERPE